MPCFVTGNLQTLGASFAQGTVVFQLYNIGQGSMPQVLGVSEFPSLKYVAVSDANGNIGTSLWGNDVINPANTVYLVTLRDFYGNEVGPIIFSITGASFNLNTAAPVTSIVPPTYVGPTAFATGAQVSIGNFTLTGWGVGATIIGVTGVQQRCQITITAGSSPTVSPTILFTFPGAYPTQALSIVTMVGGSGQISDFAVTTSLTATTATYLGLPFISQTYIITFDTVGT